jgi:hypothetical protein
MICDTATLLDTFGKGGEPLGYYIIDAKINLKYSRINNPNPLPQGGTT